MDVVSIGAPGKGSPPIVLLPIYQGVKPRTAISKLGLNRAVTRGLVEHSDSSSTVSGCTGTLAERGQGTGRVGDIRERFITVVAVITAKDADSALEEIKGTGKETTNDLVMVSV